MIRTEIPQLDALLGHVKVQEGSVIIIKGGPGSGKTTLGLQILNNNLEKIGDTIEAAFISLEVPFEKAINYARENYGFNELIEGKPKLHCVSKSDVLSPLKESIKDMADNGSHKLLHAIMGQFLGNNANANKKGSTQNNNSCKKIIFIDSLNLLIDLIKKSAGEKLSLREITHLICGMSSETISGSKPIFIFSVEYHSLPLEDHVFISESFLCDIEILLSIEPIRETALKPKAFISGAGYEIEVDKEGKKAYEYRSFCRVIKSRYGKNDSRRCAYDIKGGKGLSFYDTFPGDGQISLFYENESQKNVWDDFFKEDIPHQFPSLRYEYFKRKHLQQTFTTQRRIAYIPDKTDLYLTSLDNYWIHWFGNLWRKSNIREILESHTAFNSYFAELKKVKIADLKDLVVNRLHSVLIGKRILVKNYLEAIESSRSTETFQIQEEINNFFYSLAYDRSKNVFLKLPNKEKVNADHNGIRDEVPEQTHNIGGDAEEEKAQKSISSEMLVINQQTNDSKTEVDISPKYCSAKKEFSNPKVYCINGISRILYMNETGAYNFIDYPHDMYIVGNEKGMIIQCVKGKQSKILITNHSHIEVQLLETQRQDKNSDKYNTLIFDIQNGITYKNTVKSEIFENEGSSPFSEEFKNNQKYYALIDGVPSVYKNDTTKGSAFDHKKVKDIIDKFVSNNCNKKLEELLIALSSENKLRCIECHHLTWLLSQCDVKPNEIKIVSQSQSADDAIEKCQIKLNGIAEGINSKVSSNTFRDENVYTLLKELCTDRYIKCNFSELKTKSDKEIIDCITQRRKLNNRICDWEGQYDAIFSSLSPEVATSIKAMVQTDFLNISDILANIDKIFSLKETTIMNLIDNNAELKNAIAEHCNTVSLQLEERIHFLLHFLIEKKEKNVLCPLKKSDLRLFGERNSEIIEELRSYDFPSNRPIHHPDLIFSFRNFDEFISVPYDANISFLVYNKAELKKFYDYIEDNKNQSRELYIKLVKNVYENRQSLVSKVLSDKPVNVGDFDIKLNKHINRSILFKHPSTWEELVAILLFYPKIVQETSTDENAKSETLYQPYNFLIETQTYDTYLTTFLEMLWNCGGDIHTSPDYLFKENDSEPLLKKHLLNTLYLLGLLFNSGCIPENSTLEPEKCIRHYNADPCRWIFARHWFSTFIELLTAKKEENGTQKLLWEEIKYELGIMPIPVGLDQYISADNPMEVKHISCWGDWHFAILKGSENTALAVELINTLMSSRSIADRAEKCAHLPTVEAFYNIYGKNNCINIPDRVDDGDKLPRITYNEIRNAFFKNAKSRSQIFDYHHYMREIHAVIKYTEHISIRDKNLVSVDNPQYPEYLLRDISHKIDEAILDIKRFGVQKFLDN